ncbi:MAG: Cyclic pyranopterin monophosphate synthase [Syntrophorhabdaceae bacterium PtaU1.Bin034]|nr:MAG: Cyclic pyranopterin monophosphate synthase [Syntrophorhabdaceae bacterium PtaU1.Bin034]
MLMDNFNRIINYLRISITDRCNLRCKYCTESLVPFIPHDEVLHYEEIIRFVRIAASLGVRKVRLTGGEPLRRAGISFLLREINAIDKIEDISLTTNGLDLAERVEELKDAGLRRINISLDSLKRERFSYITGVDAHDRVMNSIAKAKDAGLDPVKINTVIIKDFNDDEVVDFADFARDRGVQVRFIEFMPFGQEALWDSSKILSSAYLENLIRQVYDIEPVTNSEKGPAKMFRINGTEGRIGFISPMSSHICNECNRIRLTPDGKLRPCLFSDVEYDLKKLLRGNATDEQVMDFMRDVVKAKPERKHEAGAIRKCQRSMRNIGG